MIDIHPPPKKEERPPRRRSQLQHQLRRRYTGLSFLQSPFERIFWCLEQSKARVQAQLANPESGCEQ